MHLSINLTFLTEHKATPAGQINKTGGGFCRNQSGICVKSGQWSDEALAYTFLILNFSTEKPDKTDKLKIFSSFFKEPVMNLPDFLLRYLIPKRICNLLPTLAVQIPQLEDPPRPAVLDRHNPVKHAPPSLYSPQLVPLNLTIQISQLIPQWSSLLPCAELGIPWDRHRMHRVREIGVGALDVLRRRDVQQIPPFSSPQDWDPQRPAPDLSFSHRPSRVCPPFLKNCMKKAALSDCLFLKYKSKDVSSKWTPFSFGYWITNLPTSRNVKSNGSIPFSLQYAKSFR